MKDYISLLIGSYTRGNKTRAGEGITMARFDPDTGELTPHSVFRDIINPSYLVPDGDRVYAVSEQADRAGEVVCLKQESAELQVLWRASSEGKATCHLTLDRPRGVVHAVSYRDGRLISLDARSGGRLALIQYEGHGPHRARQERSHAHQVRVTPDGRFLLVPDLGSDKIWRHRLDEAGVPEQTPEFIPLPPGCGPRHLVFHSDDPRAYVLGELDGRIHCVDWLSLRTRGAARSIAPDGAEYPHGASAIRLHPTLPCLYAAHRASGSLARMRVEAHGVLGEAEIFEAGGEEPRDFILTADGRWLLVACQHSDQVAVYRVDQEGRLTAAGKTAIPAACCVAVSEKPDSKKNHE